MLIGAGASIIEKRVTTEVEHLDIVPATLSLANFDREPALSVTKLRTALRDLGDSYDFIVIDTPPNFGLLLTTALTAATHVLIPVQAAPFALTGLQDLMSVVKNAQDLNEGLSVLGTVCTLYDTRTSVSGASYRALTEMMPKNVSRRSSTGRRSSKKLRQCTSQSSSIRPLPVVPSSTLH